METRKRTRRTRAQIAADAEAARDAAERLRVETEAAAQAEAEANGGSADAASVLPQEARDTDAPFVRTEVAPKVKRKRGSGSVLAKKAQAKQAEQTATVILVILDGAIATMLGEEARMTEAERVMIAQPLGRILLRMDSRVNEAIEKWTDPILLAFGLLSYGLRLAAIASRDQGDDDERKPPREWVPPAPRDNGRPLTEDVPPASPPLEVLDVMGAGGMVVEHGSN